MHDLLLTIQYITVAALFAEVLIVFFRWKSGVHSYLLLACFATFVSNIGYLFELKAGSEEAYITALKLSYVGRIWIVFAFFLFAARICSKRIPKGVVAALLTVHIGVYLAILTVGSNSLYYTDFEFIPDPVLPRFYHGDGTVHDLYMGMEMVLSLLALYWVVREYRNNRNRNSRAGKRFLMVALAFGVQIVCFVLQMAKMIEVTHFYDLNMPGALIGTVFLLIGILGFDLLGTREIAKDFAIDRISEGIIAVDSSGRIQYYNEPATRIYPQFRRFYAKNLFGKSPARKSLSGSEEADLLPEDIANLTPYDIISSIQKAVESGESLKVGDRIYSPEETDLVFAGESYGKAYTLVDDTERLRYMEELKEQKEIADSANEAKSKFLASMSHDIRTPINAVLGMNEMILRESEDAQILDYSEKIEAAGNTLLGLINDILDLSKIEAGKLELIPGDYDLPSMLKSLVNMVALRADAKGLLLEVKVDPRLPSTLLGDELRMKQIITNLLTNAVKYTEEGTVTFAVGFEKKDDDRIALNVSVSDTGAGIKEEDLPKLFTEFDRIEEGRHRNVEGTGLGLSITRDLLVMMGSHLEVESEYGRGSNFHFTVEQPVKDWQEIGDFEKILAGLRNRKKKYSASFTAPEARVLAIDDTPMNLEVFKNLLKSTLVQIDRTTDGDEALALCQKKKYDVIFLDQMMPGKDGVTTLRELRASGGPNAGTKVICMTANAIAGAREGLLAAGFDDYLAKPVVPAELEEMLKNSLPPEKVQGAAGTEAQGSNEAGEGGATTQAEGAAGKSAGAGDGSALPDFLSRLEELDIEEGLRLNGDEETYLKTLSTYAGSVAGQCDEIESLLLSGTFGDLTTKIHALKSTSKVAGATEIGDFAQALENAGASGDFERLKKLTPGLLERCRELGEALSPLSEEKDLPEISTTELKEALALTVEFYSVGDFGSMLGIAEKLKNYSFPPEEKERCEALIKAAGEFDYEAMAKVAKG